MRVVSSATRPVRFGRRRWWLAIAGLASVALLASCSSSGASSSDAAPAPPRPVRLSGSLRLLPALRLAQGSCPARVPGYPAATGNDIYEPNGDPLPSPLPADQRPYVGCLQTGAGLTVGTAGVNVITEGDVPEVHIYLTSPDATRLAELVSGLRPVVGGLSMVAVVVDGRLVEGLGFDGESVTPVDTDEIPVETDELPPGAATSITRELTGSAAGG